MGADGTLARMLYEKHMTRQFTPVGLSEIYKSRTYNTDKSVNMARLGGAGKIDATRCSRWTAHPPRTST